MFGNRKYKGSSGFLRSANNAFQSSRAEPDPIESADNVLCTEGNILAAVSQLKSPTVKALAQALKCPPSEVHALVEKLSAEGFVKGAKGGDEKSPLSLSEIGKRALLYSHIAKF